MTAKPDRRLLCRAAFTATLLTTGALGHAIVDGNTAAAQKPAPKPPAVSITLKDARGATFASAQGSDLGRFRYRLTAHLKRPILSGRYVLRFQSRDRSGRVTGNLSYDIAARPR